jgi:hypothetical protein
MREVLLAISVVILAYSDIIAAASAEETGMADYVSGNARQLTENVAVNQLELPSTQEERRKSRSGTAVRSGAIASGNVPVSNNNGGATVTVTKYNNNGLLQRFKRWWKKLFGGGSASSTRRLGKLPAVERPWRQMWGPTPL